MMVIAKCPFHDAQDDLLREAGDRFDCSEDRARHLAALSLVAIAAEQPKKAVPRAKKAK